MNLCGLGLVIPSPITISGEGFPPGTTMTKADFCKRAYKGAAVSGEGLPKAHAQVLPGAMCTPKAWHKCHMQAHPLPLDSTARLSPGLSVLFLCLSAFPHKSLSSSHSGRSISVCRVQVICVQGHDSLPPRPNVHGKSCGDLGWARRMQWEQAVVCCGPCQAVPREERRWLSSAVGRSSRMWCDLVGL